MKTKIGGQAVLEGVMMRGSTSMALAVRDEQGNIRVDTKRLATKKPWYKKVPFLRGVINLAVSMIQGTAIINKSAEVFAEEEFEQDNGSMGLMMALAVVIGLALAMLLFVYLPTQLTSWIITLFGIGDITWIRSLIEGVLKVAIIIAYMGGISHMKEIARLYQYHGAEHKTIACYEAGEELTPANVQKHSRYHDRCGTSFIVFVMILSIILMLVVESICYAVGFDAISVTWVRTLIKLAMLPLTAGISYEMLMLLASHNWVIFKPLQWLGRQFQKITTKEPDDSMCEVAIMAFNKVLAMDADVTMAEEHFPQPMTLEQFREHVRPLAELAYGESYNVDWLICDMVGVKEDKLDKIKYSYGWQMRVSQYIKKVTKGKPIAQVIGATTFMDNRILVNKHVLIPRQETELVVEKALTYITKSTKVLDLCSGSGAIGLTIALAKKCPVTLADISTKALELSKKSAAKLKAKVKFVETDMFSNISGTFDIIVSNPPYIPTDVIATLDDSVSKHEPHLALDGGADGLDYYRTIATNAKQYLAKGGTVVLEIGYNQGADVVGIFANCGYHNVEAIDDYSGNNRIVVASN